MKAMILGAGVGSRLDPLTRALPKPAVPVVGKPVLGHICDLLRRHGITEIVVNVHYLADRLMRTVGDGSAYGVKITYAPEDKLWGDGGGLKRVAGFFDGQEDILVIGGDDLTDTDLTAIIARHKESGARATIGVTPVNDPSEFGVAVTDSQNFITQFQEKPRPGEELSHLANTGIYVFSRRVLDFIPPATFFGLGKDLLPMLLERGEPILAVPSDAYWKDVGNLNVYRQVQRDAISGKVEIDLPPGAERLGTCVVCAGARVDGEISDYTVVGPGAIVEAGARVRNSLLWDDACVKERTHLEGGIVCSGVTIGCSHGIFGGIFVEQTRLD